LIATNNKGHLVTDFSDKTKDIVFNSDERTNQIVLQNKAVDADKARATEAAANADPLEKAFATFFIPKLEVQPDVAASRDTLRAALPFGDAATTVLNSADARFTVIGVNGQPANVVFTDLGQVDQAVDATFASRPRVVRHRRRRSRQPERQARAQGDAGRLVWPERRRDPRQQARAGDVLPGEGRRVQVEQAGRRERAAVQGGAGRDQGRGGGAPRGRRRARPPPRPRPRTAKPNKGRNNNNNGYGEEPAATQAPKPQDGAASSLDGCGWRSSSRPIVVVVVKLKIQLMKMNMF
jgi:hypothetical protein